MWVTREMKATLADVCSNLYELENKQFSTLKVEEQRKGKMAE